MKIPQSGCYTGIPFYIMRWKARPVSDLRHGWYEYFPAMLKIHLMEATTVNTRIDQAIENYKRLHGGNNPLYCIMSAEEADELADALRHENGDQDEVIITTYQDIKIVRNSLMERGEYVLSNELPETGS
jgi:glyoxylate utilization-related uncharacterized protein